MGDLGGLGDLGDWGDFAGAVDRDDLECAEASSCVGGGGVCSANLSPFKVMAFVFFIFVLLTLLLFANTSKRSKVLSKSSSSFDAIMLFKNRIQKICLFRLYSPLSLFCIHPSVFFIQTNKQTH